MNYKKEVVRIMDKFDGFTDGVRFLMLSHRSKEGGHNRDRKQFKRIANGQDEFAEILEEMLEVKHTSKKPYRIYSCVNERDINKAIRLFKQNQLDADYYDEESKNSFYFDIKNRWISALMRHQSRAETNFLIDLDTKNKDEVKETEEFIFRAIGRNSLKYETKNGYHFITPPFNPKLMPGYDIKKDGLLLLSY